MKSVWGLFVALVGLLLIWLWATGRLTATWQSIVTGQSQQPAQNAQNVQQPNGSQTPNSYVQPSTITGGLSGVLAALRNVPEQIGKVSIPTFQSSNVPQFTLPSFGLTAANGGVKTSNSQPFAQAPSNGWTLGTPNPNGILFGTNLGKSIFGGAPTGNASTVNTGTEYGTIWA